MCMNTWEFLAINSEIWGEENTPGMGSKKMGGSWVSSWLHEATPQCSPWPTSPMPFIVKEIIISTSPEFYLVSANCRGPCILVIPLFLSEAVLQSVCSWYLLSFSVDPSLQNLHPTYFLNPSLLENIYVT